MQSNTEHIPPSRPSVPVCGAYNTRISRHLSDYPALQITDRISCQKERLHSIFQKLPDTALTLCLFLAEYFAGTDSEVQLAVGRNDNTKLSTSLMGVQSDTSLLTLALHPQEGIICKLQVCERICLRRAGEQTHTDAPRHKCEEIPSTPKPVTSMVCSFAARKAGHRGFPLKK